jgi:protein-disulfide isomerase
MSEAPSSKLNIFERFVPTLILISVALAFMVGVLWQKVNTLEKGGNTTTTTAGAPAAPAAPTITLDQIKGVFGKNVIKIGDENRKLLVVEVADPSCPWCHVAGGKDKELYSQMGVDASYVAPVPELKKLVDDGLASYAYVYYPGHGNGEMGMKAIYCANEKGKFWEAHDLIMNNAGYNLLNTTVKNDKTQSGKIAEFLKDVVDTKEMKSCLDSGKYDSVLTENSKIGSELGVTGTPSFFLNTTNFPGAVPFDQMKSAVDAALK